uniref:Uncharacterized protein n=1 Tax=Aegilops tauschii TaxID=37682 RepID=M8BUV1_AEGTA
MGEDDGGGKLPTVFHMPEAKRRFPRDVVVSFILADEHGRSSRCPEVQVERDGADAQYGVTAGVRDDRQSGTMKIKTELSVLLGILSE